MTAPTTDPIRILLVDDHALARSGLAAMLSVDPRFRIIAEAPHGESALVEYHRHQPQITLMDVRLPGMDGIEATRRLRSTFPKARIILLSSDGLEADIARGRAAGACGFVLKTVTREQLTEVILQVLAHGWCSPYDPAKNVPGHADLLSLRELQVLELIRRGLSNKDAAKALHISPHTVLSHLKGIFAKLGVANRAEAVTAAFERGYLRIEGGARGEELKG